tara:strand:- start:257 stop:538 length:282 start_codon:yes stop_codon:yes gene_type:complete
VLREWDNSPSRLAPPASSLEVWFDVIHSYTPALPASALPSRAAELRLAPSTNYSSWATYATHGQNGRFGGALMATMGRPPSTFEYSSRAAVAL